MIVALTAPCRRSVPPSFSFVSDVSPGSATSYLSDCQFVMLSGRLCRADNRPFEPNEVLACIGEGLSCPSATLLAGLGVWTTHRPLPS